ncbi:type I-F CRISPR-associated protein Csy1 [Azotobacter beijerinckii]|uniref:type I-F CRISPR-associated protein Csy1 n=1 Tax=Azotobacter beijerinckii TaxID=170623 RepID=UPI00295428BB|nr:type I-F CRISPR-associated protein Csy1 [Azotobacter beijerinckii]MDV7211661.1 type I-F CRISPR-associated protein Csy1 [Azotobacter beijerinckii]
MSEESERPSRAERFRSAIAAFIEARREAKLKGKDDDAGVASKYDYATWLADAARRVGQIQAVTHVLKATHPDARGSSLHVVPGSLPQRTEIGTHVLGDDYAEDVVGNAAALDVFKFLKIEVDDRRLLDWMQAGDADLRSALHPDAAVATGWMDAFGKLVRSDPTPSSHEAAKQVYWLVGEEPSNDVDYHLLQPLFSSSLAHAIHADIQDARFGEGNKLARQAFRTKEAHEAPYRDYRNLVARKLGGTKPQNISQLNSERGGINYLLASLPPLGWKQFKLRNMKSPDDLWVQFKYFGDVRNLMKALANFLLSRPAPIMETQITREGIEQALGAYLSAFADMVHDTLEPGWTRNPDCDLERCEKLWLDPGRLELPKRTDTELHKREDEEFEAAYHWGDWPDEIAGRFANWINAQLREAGMPTVGDAEHKHWARQAIVDAAWPVPLQRRAPKGGEA